jgi:hypothetical protein
VSSGQLTGRAAVESDYDSGELLRDVLSRYEQEFSGEGDDFAKALEDAYEKAKVSGHKVFKVEHIFIRGDNPLSGYGVVISPDG